MGKLLFFSRVAFVCNLFFIFTFFMHYIPALKNAFVASTLIIIGLVMSVIINALVSLISFYLLLSGRQVKQHVPFWLMITNFLFFVIQAILLIK
jgi:hypothetical protein